MLETSSHIHVLRDPTRGGIASTLNEIARQSQVSILLDEASIPVRPAVQAACEMLGFDPLYIANEGKLLAIVAADDGEKVLEAMRATRYGEDAVIVGQVRADPAGRVLLKTAIGTTRIVDMLAGEMLPRIC
jgi:hydrogenase expression/formation protein HypE